MPLIETFNKEFLLHLADNALVLGHRNSEWTGHGPILEQDIAISNIALDLIGQARNFYQYAAILFNDEEPGTNQTEDSLAYLRDAREYRNFLMLELPKGDWALTTLRQFLFSCWQKQLFLRLKESSNSQLAAIAEKSLKGDKPIISDGVANGLLVLAMELEKAGGECCLH